MSVFSSVAVANAASPESLQKLKATVPDQILQSVPADPSVTPPAADGRWKDIDYSSSPRANWPARQHLVRLRSLSRASRLGDAAATPQALRALDAWLDADFQNPNWWHNEIGTPLLLGESLLLLGEPAADRIPRARPILARSDLRSQLHRNRPDWFKAGQNGIWFATAMLYQGILFEDPELIREAAQRIVPPMTLTTGEGIQPDFSFHQHGAQLYNGGYGEAFLDSMARLIPALQNTPWAPPKDATDTVIAFLLDGDAWMLWRDRFDWGAMGRELARKRPAADENRLRLAVANLADLPHPRQAEIQALLQRLDGKGEPLAPHGSRYFWRSDFLSHRRPAWTAMIKLGSSRVLASETGNDENLFAEALAHGLCMIRHADHDAFEDMPPLWDWSLLPGSTQFASKPREIDWGNGMPKQSAKGSFTGGIANNRGSSAVHDLDVNGLQAWKHWFAHDSALIGSVRLRALRGSTPARTTILAQRARGPLRIWTDTEIQPGDSPVENVRALWHDQVLYLLPAPVTLHTRRETRSHPWSRITKSYGDDPGPKHEVIEAWVQHCGPTETLHWIAIPDTAPENIPARLQDPPVAFSSDEIRTTAWWPDASLLQVIFHAPARIAGPWGELETDSPCILQLHTPTGEVLLADPSHSLVNITLRLNGKSQRIPLPSTDGQLGSSITAQF